MTRRPIPHAVIIQSFFWAGSPRDVASFLSHWYGTIISPREIIDQWEEESVWNPLLREARPATGFGHLDPYEVKLLERMVRAGSCAEGMAS